MPMGLLFISGVYRAAHLYYKDLWDKDGPPILKLIISYDRFLFCYVASGLIMLVIEE